MAAGNQFVNKIKTIMYLFEMAIILIESDFLTSKWTTSGHVVMNSHTNVKESDYLVQNMLPPYPVVKWQA